MMYSFILWRILLFDFILMSTFAHGLNEYTTPAKNNWFHKFRLSTSIPSNGLGATGTNQDPITFKDFDRKYITFNFKGKGHAQLHIQEDETKTNLLDLTVEIGGGVNNDELNIYDGRLNTLKAQKFITGLTSETEYRSYWIKLDKDNDKEISVGLCNDPGNNELLKTTGDFLQFQGNYISISTTADNIGEWQFASDGEKFGGCKDGSGVPCTDNSLECVDTGNFLHGTCVISSTQVPTSGFGSGVCRTACDGVAVCGAEESCQNSICISDSTTSASTTVTTLTTTASSTITDASTTVTTNPTTITTSPTSSASSMKKSTTLTSTSSLTTTIAATSLSATTSSQTTVFVTQSTSSTTTDTSILTKASATTTAALQSAATSTQSTTSTISEGTTPATTAVTTTILTPTTTTSVGTTTATSTAAASTPTYKTSTMTTAYGMYRTPVIKSILCTSPTATPSTSTNASPTSSSSTPTSVTSTTTTAIAKETDTSTTVTPTFTSTAATNTESSSAMPTSASTSTTNATAKSTTSTTATAISTTAMTSTLTSEVTTTPFTVTSALHMQESDDNVDMRTVVGATIGGIVGLAAIAFGLYLILSKYPCHRIAPINCKGKKDESEDNEDCDNRASSSEELISESGTRSPTSLTDLYVGTPNAKRVQQALDF